MKPFFSIVVPVYNQKGKMERCVESLKNQTFRDFEVIFVDDGSTDASYEYLRQCEAETAQFHVVRHEENRSLLAARYTGMRNAKGNYLLFIDSDDSVSPDACRILYDKLQQKNVDILFFGSKMLPSENILPAQSVDEPLRACLDNSFPPSVWKNCYSMGVIEKALERTEAFYCNMGEDSFLSCVFFSCAETYSRVEDTLYYYTEGQGMSSAVANSAEKTARDLRSVEASGEHIIDCIGKYAPQYSELAEKKAENMAWFVMFQHVYFEEDWDRVFEYMELFNNEKHRKVFERGCRKLFPAKVKRSLGMKVTNDDFQ